MKRVAPTRSVIATVAPVSFLLTIAHCSFAESTCFKLATHDDLRLLSLALTKFGTAIAIKIPMIKTTIMISTSVNARLFLVVRFMNF